MGKYITKFETQALFDEAKDNLDKPHVSLTVDNDTVHYLEQQAPQPVVRPLPSLENFEDIRAFILAKPVGEDGYHECNFIIASEPLDAGDEEVYALLNILMGETTISGYLEVCDEVGDSVHVVNARNVTTSVLCDEVPCAAETTILKNAIEKVRSVLELIAGDDYEVDEIMIEQRGYKDGARVDAIIDY